MRLLLDTHVALWAVLEPHRLDQKTRGSITDTANDVAVSPIALWEIAIKRSVRRGAFGVPELSPRDAEFAFAEAGFAALAIVTQHFGEVERLPFHHRDPFDRLMIAQARCERMTLLTHDKALAAYGDCVMLV